MKLYLVHCGFYDTEIADGIYESHINLFVAAENFEDARATAKLLPEYKAQKMHVDGLQEILAVNGMRVELVPDASLDGHSIVHGSRHRDLAPKKSEAET
jgi:hypothetical protein